MKIKSILKQTGKAFTVVTHSPKLRALAAAGITAGFAVIGLHVDGDTALALMTAAGALAGWGPITQTDEGDENA